MAVGIAAVGVCVVSHLRLHSDRVKCNDAEERLRQLRENLPPHGGDVEAAAIRYGIEPKEWIDLSTGINPQPYPIPEIPIQAFQDLPYWRPEFLKAAENYYKRDLFLPVAGSQQAIQALPDILIGEGPNGVLLPEVGYQEHAKQWGNSVAELAYYSSLSANDMRKDIDARLAMNTAQHLVVIRPNNPTGVEVDNDILFGWARKLSAGSYLIVDEAFVDVGHQSLLTTEMLPSNIIVLRSFGKFFGLAGVRLGFVFAHQLILEKLVSFLGVWQVNGPAQAIATVAMNDTHWQIGARREIAINSEMMKGLLAPLKIHFNFEESVGASLFSSYAMKLDLALALNDALAKVGLLTRVVAFGSEEAFLRFGCIDTGNHSGIKRIKEIVEILCNLGNIPAILDFQAGSS